MESNKDRIYSNAKFLFSYFTWVDKDGKVKSLKHVVVFQKWWMKKMVLMFQHLLKYFKYLKLLEIHKINSIKL